VLSSSAPLRSSGSPSADSAVETNADVQAILARQAALRRVATLAAHAISNERLFAAVNEELARLVGADAAALLRLGPDETVTLLAAWNAAGAAVTVNDQQPVNAALRRLRDSARPMRCGPADVPLTGPFIAEIRRLGIRATVAVPIQVDGQVWGVSVAASRSPEPFPAATEARMLEFAELVAIAISNAQSHAELAASRARLIAAADESRRRIQRDVHDGAQQRLVHTIVRLKLATAMLEQSGHPATEIVSDALESAVHASADLRDLVSGVRPRALRDGGLHEAINALLQDIDLPASVEITRDRLSPHVETTAYFVIAEALNNAVKHAKARRLAVRATVRDGALELEIRDDGVGGAQIHHGTGLVGLVDRVESIGGRIAITSPSGAGTTVAVSLPTDSPSQDLSSTFK
jgi:signal transduction histidine kinase